MPRSGNHIGASAIQTYDALELATANIVEFALDDFSDQITQATPLVFARHQFRGARVVRVPGWRQSSLSQPQ